MRQMSTFYTQISNILWQDAKKHREWNLKTVCACIGFSLFLIFLLALSACSISKFPQFFWFIGILTGVIILVLLILFMWQIVKTSPKDNPPARIARLKKQMHGLGVESEKRQNELIDEIMQSIEANEKEVSISLKLAGTVFSIVFLSQIPFFFRYIINHEDNVLNIDQLIVLSALSFFLALALAHMAIAIFPDLRYGLQYRKQKERVLKFIYDLRYYEGLDLENLAKTAQKENEKQEINRKRKAKKRTATTGTSNN